jgi:hypothetical protein
MRRAPFGYRRGDVEAALAARDAELAELRQDVAALWLAFAQHDRLLRGDSPEQEIAAPTSDRSERPSAPADRDPGAEQAAARAASIGAQLSELDQVLSAIEEATRTLERTYASEVGKPAAASTPAGEEVEAPEEPPPGTEDQETESESGDR